MKDEIQTLLAHHAPLKAKDIARELSLKKSEVNSVLYAHQKEFKKDNEHRWSLAVEQELLITLPEGWVGAEVLEGMLRDVGPALDHPTQAVRIRYPSAQCKTMIDCTARLLALVNQLAARGGKITVDLTDALPTHRYLNRAGFFDLVRDEVSFVPPRPAGSTARRYQGQSNTLVEFGLVDLKSESERLALAERLTEAFVRKSTPDYRVAAFTVFGELIQNVAEHSGSDLRGFAGLQIYGGSRPHIVTVVSDSGVGIANTLRPALQNHYPDLFKKYGEKSLESDIGIVTAAMSKGRISRFGKGRGLGFESSRKQAARFDFSLTVRQEDFCLRFQYRQGKFVKVDEQRSLAKLQGTHICFDFYLPKDASTS